MQAQSPVRSRPFALATILGVLFLTFLDTTVVTVVLGDIQYTLGAGVIGLQWVVNAYALVFAALMLFAGSLGDRLGRKRMMLAGIVVFCAGSIVCAVAPSVGWLIAGRAVMGIGAAASEPGTLSMIRQLYPDGRERARALGGWAAISGLALAAGPVIGGLLGAAGDWRAVFWFNLAAGVILLASAMRCLPESVDRGPGRVDLAGFVLGAISLGAAIVAAMLGEQYGFARPFVIGLFVLAGVSACALIMVERRATSPIIQIRHLRPPAVSGSLFAAFALYFGIFAIFFFTALYLDLVEGYSGLRTAALFAPMAATIVVGSVISGWWVGAGGARWPLVVGSALSAGGIVATRAALTAEPGFGPLTVALAVAGLGFGLAVVPVTSVVLGHVPARLSGMAAGATNTARQIGSVVGVTVLGAVVSSTMATELDASLGNNPILGQVKDAILAAFKTGGERAKGLDFAHPNPIVAPIVDSTAAAFRQGIHLALSVSAGLILLSAVVTLLTRRGLAPPTPAER